MFVTGGTGFLGAYIISELVTKGYHVHAVRRGNKQPFFISPDILQKVNWIQGDVLDPIFAEQALEGMDAVVHSAAQVSFRKADHAAMLHNNIEGTANMVNAALSKNIARFVHISSVASLGRTAQGEEVTEKKKWEDNDTNTTYALSKYHSEMEVWRGTGEGLNAVILNPSTILGYGDWNQSSCALFRNAWDEFPWYTNGVNGFVDVQDVARAAVMLMESNISSERFIVNGDNWSFKKLFDSMADAFAKKRPAKEATPFLSALAWRMEKLKSLFNGKEPLLTRETARIANTSTYFNNSKILSALPGFSFTPLNDCIREACAKYRTKT
ncbi:MAG: NAD-dependent epimerase/dehydratase family protein [Bacteroidota bacterium]|nr:NAD-dependent epimerase/dehydratase family protein [Bacteroidota bacterium]